MTADSIIAIATWLGLAGATFGVLAAILTLAALALRAYAGQIP